MQVKINIKGVSNRTNKIKTVFYDYPDYDKNITLAQFLADTTKISVKKFNDSITKKDTQDIYDLDNDAFHILKTLSKENIAEQAESGKISFGVLFNDRTAEEDKAIANTLQCFEDGMIAVFINDKRYEDISEVIDIKELRDTLEKSGVTFVRLTFLAGRMW